MSYDVNICFAYTNRGQAEQFKSCKKLTESVISLLNDEGRKGTKTEFSHLSGKIKKLAVIFTVLISLSVILHTLTLRKNTAGKKFQHCAQSRPLLFCLMTHGEMR